MPYFNQHGILLSNNYIIEKPVIQLVDNMPNNRFYYLHRFYDSNVGIMLSRSPFTSSIPGKTLKNIKMKKYMDYIYDEQSYLGDVNSEYDNYGNVNSNILSIDTSTQLVEQVITIFIKYESNDNELSEASDEFKLYISNRRPAMNGRGEQAYAYPDSEGNVKFTIVDGSKHIDSTYIPTYITYSSYGPGGEEDLWTYRSNGQFDENGAASVDAGVIELPTSGPLTVKTVITYPDGFEYNLVGSVWY